jgi:hypothetical protein
MCIYKFSQVSRDIVISTHLHTSLSPCFFSIDAAELVGSHVLIKTMMMIATCDRDLN